MLLVCSKRCGFVVDVDYFKAKTRFDPRFCPRTNCGAPVEVTDDAQEKSMTHVLDTDKKSDSYRQVVAK